MSEASTEGVVVTVEPRYHAERSSPLERYWFFTYTVTITNSGEYSVQLVSRHWIITNATGHVEHVRGPGVVGETPVLQPGQSFTYTSACPLPTSLGSMEGTYEMEREDGRRFDVAIAPFTLVDPSELN